MACTRLLGRMLVASLAVGVALAVAGCGNQNTGPGSANGSAGGPKYAHQALTKDQIMPAAYAAAANAGTAHIALSMTGKGHGATACSCTMSATGDVAYGARRPSMAMTLTQQGHPVAMRFVGGMFYVRVPGLTPRGKFLSIDPTDKKSPLARSFASIANQMDPTDSLKNMGSAVLKAERVGKQTMDGVTLEHYKVKISTAKLLHKAGYAANAGGLPDAIDYDFWLDDRHLIRRTTFKTADVSFEETITRWGEPVDVQVPAPGQVTTMPGA